MDFSGPKFNVSLTSFPVYVPSQFPLSSHKGMYVTFQSAYTTQSGREKIHPLSMSLETERLKLTNSSISLAVNIAVYIY